MQTELRFAELRAEGRSLSGIVVRYGDIAKLPWGEERIEPGSFTDIASADVVLNRQHNRAHPLARTGGGGLTLEDTNQSLSMRAELPVTQDANDVLSLVSNGIIRGLSLEFVALRDRFEGKLRIVENARIVGLAVVDRGAYPDSLVHARESAVNGATGHKRRLWL